MKNNRKGLKWYINASYVSIALLIIVMVLAAYITSYREAILTVAAVLAAGVILFLCRVFSIANDRYESIDELVSGAVDYAEIRYHKKNDEAYISKNFTRITGIEAPSEIIDGIDYKNLVNELVSCSCDAGSDIYMAAKPETWLRVRSVDTPSFEITMINDVSEFVVCKNIIKSLKYYDSETNLLCRDAFMSKVRSVAASDYGIVGLITILVSGVDKVISFNGAAAGDKVISKVAASIKRYENPHNIFAGRTATNEFCVLFTDTYVESCKKYADKLLASAEKALGEESSGYARIYCGYAVFKGEENDADNMVAASDYAAYDAKASASGTPVEFNSESYATSAIDFQKVQVFNTVITENRIHYNFQPIVDAGTGEIFGYEALMRPEEINGMKLSPLEMLSIAEKQGMTSEIERLTFYNTVSYLSENQDHFRDKKLFVNSIPNCLLSESDYNRIFSEYSGIFDKLIVEITEGCQISKENIEILHKRYKNNRAQIALDDYGSGYANESSLISIRPDYIKIDRSIISGLENDTSKQHLVGNIISFAKNHGIKTLGEGVETREELENLIILGVDYIQGYYTSKPNAVLLLDIPADIKNEILDINIKNVGYARKTYVVSDQEPVDVVALAVKGYNNLEIKTSPVFISGDPSRTVNMRIRCEDGYKGTININDINIDSIDAPVLALGNNCEVMLKVDGSCYFSYEGIRVPESSRFILGGSGSLNIDVSGNNGVIIGGNYMQDFGEIILDMDGDLNINSKGDNIIAVGGGLGGKNSSISVLRGEISANLRAPSVIGIGAISGTSSIKISESRLGFEASGQNVVAIGSKNGNVDIECNADVTADCSGDNCCVIGTLENGSGNVSIMGGNYDLAIHAKNSVAIGAMSGKTDVSVNYGYFKLCCEGNTAVGIGDAFGSETITIINGIFDIHIASGNEFPMGTKNGKIIIHSGNIYTDSIEDIHCVSPYGDPLEKRRIETKESFRQSIVYGGSEYTYSADPADGEDHVTVYLPVGYSIEV